jgi:hypothetical protein
MSTKAQLFHAYLGGLYKSEKKHQAEQWITSLVNYQIEREDTATLHGSPSQPNADLPVTDSNNRSTESGSSFTETSGSVDDDNETLVNENSEFKYVYHPWVHCWQASSLARPKDWDTYLGEWN